MPADADPTPDPCPFCGGTNVICNEGVNPRWGVVMCAGCGALGPEIRKDFKGRDGDDWERRAIVAWNDRVERAA